MPFTNNPYSAQIRFDAAGDPVIAYYNRAANQLQLARPVPSGVTLPIDIAVTGTVSPSVARPGDPLNYTLTVANNGKTNVDPSSSRTSCPPVSRSSTRSRSPARTDDGRSAR